MKALEQGLLDLLSKRSMTIFVPTYQGVYEWGTQECETFFYDVLETAMSNREGHFFGSVVYYRTDTVFGQPDKLILVDGQQRLVTTMLFLTALRDIIDHSAHEDFINATYIINTHGSEDTTYKMKLNESVADWDTFVNIMQNEAPTVDNRKNRVYKNYQYFVRELTNIKDTGQLKLTDLISRGLDQFRVVTIELEPEKNKWENPKTVFNSVNTVTKPLLKTFVQPVETEVPVAAEIELIPELPELPLAPSILELDLTVEPEPEMESKPETESPPEVDLEFIPTIPELSVERESDRVVEPKPDETLSNIPTTFKDMDELFAEAEAFAGITTEDKVRELSGTRTRRRRLRAIDVLIILAIIVIFGALFIHLSEIFDFGIPFFN